MLRRAPRGVYISDHERMLNLVFVFWIKQDLFFKLICVDVL